MLQFGIKYFIGTGCAMVLVLVLSSDASSVRPWRLLYGYITIVVVLNEKVHPLGYLKIHVRRVEGF